MIAQPLNGCVTNKSSRVHVFFLTAFLFAHKIQVIYMRMVDIISFRSNLFVSPLYPHRLWM